MIINSIIAHYMKTSIAQKYCCSIEISSIIIDFGIEIKRTNQLLQFIAVCCEIISAP